MIVGKKELQRLQKEAKEFSIQLVGDSRTNHLEERGNHTILPSKKGGGARNKKDNRMEQDCFVETHLEPVQWLNMVYLDQIQSVAR